MTILELLNAKEGESIEFKEAKNSYEFDNLAKYACALSNRGGGRVVFGITDKRPRKVVGSLAFEQPERTRKGLIDRLHVRVDFDLLEHEGKRVLTFVVAGRPLGVPVQCDGVAWWREGDSLVMMPQEIQHQIFSESGHDFSGDICPQANLNDIDGEAVMNFRRLWVRRSGNQRLQTLSTKQLLADTRAVSEEGVTYAALILFGTQRALEKYLSQSETVFECRLNHKTGPAHQRESFRSGFFKYFNRLWELINLRNAQQHYRDGMVMMPVATFNEGVCREAILNAVTHRNYQQYGNIFITQYPTTLIIDSPGGFLPGITPKSFLNRQAARNRLLAEILATSGLVEHAGQGMNMIYEECIKEAKALPDYSQSDSYLVRMILNGTITDKSFLVFQKHIPADQYSSLTTEDLMVLNAVCHKQPITSELRPNSISLCELGLLEKVGRGTYKLAAGYDKISLQSEELVTTLQTDQECKNNILSLLQRNGEAGTRRMDLAKVVIGRTQRQLRMLLDDLVGEGRIVVRGNGNGARWFLK